MLNSCLWGSYEVNRGVNANSASFIDRANKLLRNARHAAQDVGSRTRTQTSSRLPLRRGA